MSEEVQLGIKGRKDEENTKLLCDCYAFESHSAMRKSISRLCYGNLFLVGTVWVEALKSMLLGTKMALVPVVAAKGPLPPKPKKMKYQELPLETAPHSEYTTAKLEKINCCGYKRKLLREYLLPSVSCTRKNVQNQIQEISCLLDTTYDTVRDTVTVKGNEFLTICRDESNYCYRKTAVSIAAAAGFFLTSRKQFLVLRKTFVGAAAAAFVGSICFPKDTDDAFREVCYWSAKLLIAAHNFYSGGNYALTEHLPCPSNLPPPAPPGRRDFCGEEISRKRAEYEALLK